MFVVYMFVDYMFAVSMRSLSARQFYGQTEDYVFYMKHLNTTFTIVFTIECVLKLMAYGVRVRACSVCVLTQRLTARASLPHRSSP